MKMKVIKSFFEESSGVSGVTLSTPLGEFSGYAFFNSKEEDGEDADPRMKSRFEGCLIAEMRAKILALKAQKKKLKTELSVLNEFNSRAKEMAAARNDLDRTITAVCPKRAFNAMYTSRLDELNKVEAEIKMLQKAIPKMIEDYYKSRKRSLAAIDSLNGYKAEIQGK